MCRIADFDSLPPETQALKAGEVKTDTPANVFGHPKSRLPRPIC